jgi:hypothetical protein
MTAVTKTETIVILVALALMFALGRYSVPDNQVTTTDDKTAQNHTITTIITLKKANGETSTTETIDSKTKTKEEDRIVQMEAAKSKINVSALASVNVTKGDMTPLYGISVSKEILGPVRVGVFGLTNGIVGVSVGLDF